MAQGVLDLVAKAKDAERAAVLEEVREWLEQCWEYAEDEESWPYRTIGEEYVKCFHNAFLAGKEGA